MRERSQAPTPMLFLLYHLNGGLRKMLAVGLGYLGIVMVALLVFRRILIQQPLPVIAQQALNILVGVQCVLLLLVAPNAIHRVLQRDHQTQMKESHRICPMSNTSVILGYLLGGAMPVLVPFVINLLIGGLLAVAALVPLDGWLTGNAMILNGAMTIWMLTIVFGVGPGKPISPVGAVIGLAMVAAFLAMFLPGMSLFLGIYSTTVGYAAATGRSTPMPAAMILIAAANLLLSLFCFLAASRRFRRPDLPAINGWYGLVLLGLWLVVSTLGSTAYARVSGMSTFKGALVPESLPFQWIATLTVGLLLSIWPLRGAVACRACVREGRMLRGWDDRIPDVLLLVLLPIMICGFAYVLGMQIWPALLEEGGDDGRFGLVPVVRHLSAWPAWIYTIITTVFACGLLWSIVRLAQVFGRLVLTLGIAMITLYWAVPPTFDAIRAEYLRVPYTWILGCSPVGTLMSVWGGVAVDPVGGLVVQGAVAVVFVLLAMAVGRRALAGPAVAVALPAVAAGVSAATDSSAAPVPNPPREGAAGSES